jgi:hypothetical protein
VTTRSASTHRQREQLPLRARSPGRPHSKLVGLSGLRWRDGRCCQRCCHQSSPTIMIEGMALVGGGAPGRDRTGDISLTRRVLWPAELQGQCCVASIATWRAGHRIGVRNAPFGRPGKPPSGSPLADQRKAVYRDVTRTTPVRSAAVRASSGPAHPRRPLLHSDRPARSCR